MGGEPSEVNSTLSRPEDEYSREGVDLTLIRWMLSMTPAERLQTLEQSIRSLTSLVRDRGNP